MIKIKTRTEYSWCFNNLYNMVKITTRKYRERQIVYIAGFYVLVVYQIWSFDTPFLGQNTMNGKYEYSLLLNEAC